MTTYYNQSRLSVAGGMKRMLRVRMKAKRKKPRFNRQEYFKQKKLKTKWIRPKGRKSKLRRRKKGRGSRPSPGYSPPRLVRGLSRQGLIELRVFNPKDLDNIQNKKIIIASTVGKRKRLEILKRAEELGLKISNA